MSDSQPFQSRLSACSALVIDGNSESCQTTLRMLQRMGLGEALRASRPEQGRALLEQREFDFVFCDYHFAGSPTTGQTFIGELRQSRVLPYSTVVFFVTSEAAYTQVANAAESGLDQYLLKPFTEASFVRRVETSRMRKMALREIFESMNREDFAGTLALCEQELAGNGRYWLICAQIGAEACLRLERLQRAQELYERILGASALPWARLGVARIELQQGTALKAETILKALVSEYPFYVDAYDVLGRCQVERGELEAALQTFATASRLKPTCVHRLQKLAHVAFLNQESELAIRALNRAAAIGQDSEALDPQSLLLLALTQFDEQETAGLNRTLGLLRRAAQRDPGNARLARFVEVGEVLLLLYHQHRAEALDAAHQLAQHILDPAFDVEAAGNFFYLLERFERLGFRLIGTRDWARTIALRFCVSRVTVDLLGRFARSPAYAEIIENTAQEVSHLAQSAVARLIEGEPHAAAEVLMDICDETKNARLLAILDKILRQHGSRIPDLEDLRCRVDALKRDYCSSGTQAALHFRVDGAGPGEGSERAAARDALALVDDLLDANSA